MKTSIIILTLNKFDLTKSCIQSIRKHTSEPYELIIVDNGSTDDTVEFLQNQKDIRAIYNEQNAGFAKGCNQGATIATGDSLLFLNNDTVVTENWLKNLLYVLNSNDLIGMVGPVSNSCSGRQKVNVSYSDLSGLDEFVHEHCQKYTGVAHYSCRLVGFCLLIKKKVWDEVGSFDEQFGIGNFEDDDLCLRVLEAGYISMIAMDSFVHHVGSATFRTLDVNYFQLLEQNRKKATEKWGDNINSLLNKPQISISLCMVVNNVEETITNCLESIKGIIDEIIIVDTGSTDQTKEIVSQYTNLIFNFEWNENHAEARNYSFSHATKDYILWLDPSDTLALEDRKKLFQMKRSLDPTYDSVSMIYNCTLASKSNPSYSIRRNNLIKRSKHFRWMSLKDEYLDINGEILYSDISITPIEI
jgi:GT2 family glycosyltransferase